MAKDPREYGYEGEMAMSQLKGIMQHAKQLHDMLKPDTDLPEWVQSKITLSYDYLQTAADYMATEVNESKEFYADAKRRAKADTPQEKLSPAWKAKAKARASAAGRKYPNLVDNVWAARMQESVNEEAGPSYKEELPHILKDIRGKRKGHADLRREYGSNWKRLANSTADEHGHNYNRSHLLAMGKKHMEEEAPVNSVGGGKIAGMGVGPQGEPGVGPKAMKRYKDKNAAEAPKAGRKAFSIFMQGK
jgi:hypothetical protein